jgi:acyl-CoA thioesterase I
LQMDRYGIVRRGTAFGMLVASFLVALASAQAQAPQSLAVPTAVAPPVAPTTAQRAICKVVAQKARFDLPLPGLGRRLASGQPIKIVAFGSSSTAGAGASSPAASYPSRLADELRRHFPGREITVLNRGVSGEEIDDMLARLDSAVAAEKPDLVLWQLGTNSVLRDKAVQPHATLLHEGMLRLRAIGAEIVLIDPQYAPRVIAKPNVEEMVTLIATTAKAEHVCLFHRFDLMRHWHDAEHLPFETFLSADGLHMNDWSYACLAKWMAAAIAEAATRPTATAGGLQPAR